jgi:hypothetical protein
MAIGDFSRKNRGNSLINQGENGFPGIGLSVKLRPVNVRSFLEMTALEMTAANPPPRAVDHSVSNQQGSAWFWSVRRF